MQDSEAKSIANKYNLKSDGTSKMAETIAMMRFRESRLPEDERICNDPYAIRFVNRETLELLARHPEQAQAMREQLDRFLPGNQGTLAARVRYFDDVLKGLLGQGLQQLVILGAGYDTRAYRIEGMNKIHTFEVDHPNTQRVKKEKIVEIFGSLPGHVSYVPVDLAVDDLGQRLRENGYDKSRKTLFILEGLVMYLPPKTVDETLAFMVKNSGKGSAVVFDYFPQSVVDGTSELQLGKNMLKWVLELNEPYLFGINEGEVETFLARRGFCNIKDVTSQDYKKMYFQGKNATRLVNPLWLFAYGEIE